MTVDCNLNICFKSIAYIVADSVEDSDNLSARVEFESRLSKNSSNPPCKFLVAADATVST